MTLEHKEPDRVPMDWPTSFVIGPPYGYGKLLEYMDIEAKIVRGTGYTSFHTRSINERVLKAFEIDFRRVGWSFPQKSITDNLFEDIWGIRHKSSSLHAVFDDANAPLRDAKTIEDIEEYPKWPDVKQIIKDYPLDDTEKKAKKLHENTDFAIRTSLFLSFPLNYVGLRGFTQWIIDMKTNPDLYHTVTEKIFQISTDLSLALLNQIGDYVDVAFHGDDWGQQDGPFISPKDFRKFAKPYLKNFLHTITRNYPKLKIVTHSDGSIYDILPELIDCGVQAIDPIQPLARDMQPNKLKKNFGDKLSFLGGIDVQKILPFGSISDVENHVKKIIKILAPGGGFILRPKSFQKDIPPENIDTMYKTALKYGKYSGESSI
jgi:uroporphyrinogen decarboxylase